MDNHCSTEVTDLDLWQPLHAAACWGHLEAVEILAQNGADISALTKSGETPFDITEDPDIKDRLVELAEQRLRLSEPRGKRGRSSSTRTHSIRRTSLRDKMKTTKKDVTEEGLIYMKTVTKPSREESNLDELQHSDDVVDVGDVQLNIPTSFSSPSNKPVQHVSPQPKSVDLESPPVRPSRSDRRQSNLEDQSPSITASLVPPTGSSSMWPNSSSGTEPINIHVSVTINPGVVSQSNFSSSGTLADLKRTRSQNRVSGSNSSSNISINSTSGMEKEPVVNMKPHVERRERLISQENTGSTSSPSSGRKKFAASSVEVVGPPPGKKGCCQIF